MNLKLNINTFFLNVNSKKNYKKKTNNKIIFLKKKLLHKQIKKPNYYFVKFIFYITIKKSNMFVHVLDCVGNEKFFYSINSQYNKLKNLKMHDKLERFYKILITKFKFATKKPVAIYFNNTELNYKWLLNKIFKKFFIINIKFFDKLSHNGCRKKKL